MSTLFVALACAIALVALPHLFVKFCGQLANSLGMLWSMAVNVIKKCFKAFFKVILYVLKVPLYVARDISAAFKEWGSMFKKGVASNKKKNQFREAVKNKQKRHKLANQYDEMFYEANSSLKTLKTKASSSSQVVSSNVDHDPCNLDTPTFLRKGIFQTDHEGKLRRNDFGFPIKTTVASMFSSAPSQQEPVEPTIINPEPVAQQPTTVLDDSLSNNHPSQYCYLDDEGFEPEYDPSLDIV